MFDLPRSTAPSGTSTNFMSELKDILSAKEMKPVTENLLKNRSGRRYQEETRRVVLAAGYLISPHHAIARPYPRYSRRRLGQQNISLPRTGGDERSSCSGSRVLVPFGSRRVTGTVIGFPDTSGVPGLKSVIELLDDTITPHLLALAQWMSDYYLHPLGQTIEALVRRPCRAQNRKKIKFLQIVEGDHDLGSVRGPKQRELLLLLCDRQVIRMEELTVMLRPPSGPSAKQGWRRSSEKETDEKTDTGVFQPERIARAYACAVRGRAPVSMRRLRTKHSAYFSCTA